MNFRASFLTRIVNIFFFYFVYLYHSYKDILLHILLHDYHFRNKNRGKSIRKRIRASMRRKSTKEKQKKLEAEMEAVVAAATAASEAEAGIIPNVAKPNRKTSNFLTVEDNFQHLTIHEVLSE